MLKLASVLGMLCELAALAILGLALVSSFGAFTVASAHPGIYVFPSLGDATSIGLSLGLLGGAFILPVSVYTARFRQRKYSPVPGLSSPQAQLRIILVLGALPLCALVIALLAPRILPTGLALAAMLLDSVLDLIAALISLVTYFYFMARAAGQSGDVGLPRT